MFILVSYVAYSSVANHDSNGVKSRATVIVYGSGGVIGNVKADVNVHVCPNPSSAECARVEVDLKDLMNMSKSSVGDPHKPLYAKLIDSKSEDVYKVEIISVGKLKNKDGLYSIDKLEVKIIKKQ